MLFFVFKSKTMQLRIGLLLSTIAVQVLAEKCITPNNEEAECISLYSCPALIGALATQQNIPREFVRQSNCGGSSSDPLVCCGSSANFTVPFKKDPSNTLNATKTNLIPTRRYCGLQHSDDYFRTENNTAGISEFPWLALLLFNDIRNNTPRPTIRCSGSLINTRYVLTTANCVQDVQQIKAKLVGVRLGEFNVKNETDCVDEDPKFYECSDPVVEVGIEKSIPHPGYHQMTAANDIALLRLDRTIQYSDYIRPICLPFPGTTFAKVGDTLATSGWGKITRDGKLADSKKKILTILISNEECAKIYNPSGRPIRENQMCTSEIGSNMEFGCLGDTGGPVMFSHRNQWHQEGISSFSRTGCGGQYPEVHTRVKDYLNWIEDNIQP